MKTKKKSGKTLRKSGKSQGKIREFDGIKKVGTLPDQVPPTDQVHPPGPGAPPRTRYTPRDQVHPPGTRYTPQPRACWDRRSTRGRYASYWNAILLMVCSHLETLLSRQSSHEAHEAQSRRPTRPRRFTIVFLSISVSDSASVNVPKDARPML